MFYEVIIIPASSGFGNYDVVVCDEPWECSHELKGIMAGEADAFVNLAVDCLPTWANDIRPFIRNCPEFVFACLDDQRVRYSGITEK